MKPIKQVVRTNNLIIFIVFFPLFCCVVNDIIFFSAELKFEKLTVGKIYGGLLILENWKTTRFGQIQPSGGLVSMPLMTLLVGWCSRAVISLIIVSSCYNQDWDFINVKKSVLFSHVYLERKS